MYKTYEQINRIHIYPTSSLTSAERIDDSRDVGGKLQENRSICKIRKNKTNLYTADPRNLLQLNNPFTYEQVNLKSLTQLFPKRS